MVPSTSMWLRACDLPSLLSDDDGRGRMVGFRQFVKDWATADDERRVEMISMPPQAHRPWHRLTHRRFDLARVAAVVHALCDRDDVAPPA